MVLFMGFAKSGKSTAMGEFSINATLAGYNVLYLSLEVHTSILSDRFDARLSETEMSKLVERVTTSIANWQSWARRKAWGACGC
jgi:replicative DNA helicase